MSKLTTTWWIVFYKDQLLLKKQNNKLTIPCNEQPPLPIPAIQYSSDSFMGWLTTKALQGCPSRIHISCTWVSAGIGRGGTALQGLRSQPSHKRIRRILYGRATCFL